MCHMPDTALFSIFYLFSLCKQPIGVSLIFMPIVQMKKMRLREVNFKLSKVTGLARGEAAIFITTAQAAFSLRCVSRLPSCEKLT